MKKVVVFVYIASFMISIFQGGLTSAAGCVPTGRGGRIAMQVPVLPSTGTYTLWTRMQVPDETHNRYKLEINNTTCFLVGGSSIVPKQWEWVSFHDGDLSAKVQYNFNTVKGNNLLLMGADAGVKVDRVLVVKNDCRPVDLGANCQTISLSGSSIENGSIIVPPPSNGSVSGIIIPTQSIAQNLSEILHVTYSADGQQLPVAANFGLDTTLIANGTHTLSMSITKNDGTVTYETTTIITENPETGFSPLKRWVRVHKTEIVLVSALTLVIVLGAILIFVLRSTQLKKRLLTFRGF